MVNSGRGSAGWRVRFMHLILLLEFILFSVGTATPSSKEFGDPIVTVDDSITAASKLRNILNSSPALQEFEIHSTRKDCIFPEIAWATHSRTGLLSVLRRFIAQFGSSAILESSPIEGLPDHYNRQTVFKFGSSEDRSCRKLLLREPGHPKRRLSPAGSFWAVNHHEQIHSEGRRMLEDIVSSPAFPETQQVLLGPPAPPGLVHNEKQDWNQDYAEPDVHPPSSN